MVDDLGTWESEILFRASIEGMVYALENQVVQQGQARAAFYFGILTSILDELSDRFDQLPDLCADWFDLPRGSTFADFVDLIRRVDSRSLVASVNLAYSVQQVLSEYYQTGSQESFRSVQSAIALHRERYGRCVDGSDDVIEIF